MATLSDETLNAMINDINDGIFPNSVYSKEQRENALESIDIELDAMIEENPEYKNNKEALRRVLKKNINDYYDILDQEYEKIKNIAQTKDVAVDMEEIMLKGYYKTINTFIENFEKEKLPVPQSLQQNKKTLDEYFKQKEESLQTIQKNLQAGEQNIQNTISDYTQEQGPQSKEGEEKQQEQQKKQAQQHTEETKQSTQERKETPPVATKTNPNDPFPNPEMVGFSTLKTPDDYIIALASRVLHKNEETEYMQKSDPVFYEIIQAVRTAQSGGNGSISTDAFRAMHQILQDPNMNERKERLTRRVEKINTMDDKKEKKEKEQIELLSPRVGSGLNTYQLSMHYFAQQLQKNIENQKITLKEPIDEAAVQSIIAQTAGKGRVVASPQTEITLNLFNAERGGRMDVGNFLIDQLARSWGMVVFAINAWGALKSGTLDGVMQRAPYMALGGAVTYGAAQAILADGLQKMLNPGNMPVSILKESLNNKHYVEYFSDPWEIALAKQIIVPKTGKEKEKELNKFDAMKKDITQTEDGKKLTYGSHPDPRKIGKEITRSDKKAISKNLCADELRAGGHFAHLLPENGRFQTPDKKWVTKEEFLDGLEEHDTGNQNNQPGVRRFEMLELMIDRLAIGVDGSTIQKDSHFQYLDQLHELAKQNVSKKDNENE